MTEVVAYARNLAAAIQAAGVKVSTTRPSAAVPPCVLVQPIPARVYDIQHGYTATWSILCLVPTADERGADQLDDMVAIVASVVPIETADPVAWAIPGADKPVPAYLCRYTTEVENHA